MNLIYIGIALFIIALASLIYLMRKYRPIKSNIDTSIWSVEQTIQHELAPDYTDGVMQEYSNSSDTPKGETNSIKNITITQYSRSIDLDRLI